MDPNNPNNLFGFNQNNGQNNGLNNRGNSRGRGNYRGYNFIPNFRGRGRSGYGRGGYTPQPTPALIMVPQNAAALLPYGTIIGSGAAVTPQQPHFPDFWNFAQNQGFQSPGFSPFGGGFGQQALLPFNSPAPSPAPSESDWGNNRNEQRERPLTNAEGYTSATKCAECGKRGHPNKVCCGSCDDKGFMVTCPKCNPEDKHTWDQCPNQPHSPEDEMEYLLRNRHGKPLVKSKKDVRDIDGFQECGFRPLTPEYAQLLRKQRTFERYTQYATNKQYRDYNWERKSDVGSLIHPDYVQLSIEAGESTPANRANTANQNVANFLESIDAAVNRQRNAPTSNAASKKRAHEAEPEKERAQGYRRQAMLLKKSNEERQAIYLKRKLQMDKMLKEAEEDAKAAHRFEELANQLEGQNSTSKYPPLPDSDDDDDDDDDDTRNKRPSPTLTNNSLGISPDLVTGHDLADSFSMLGHPRRTTPGLQQHPSRAVLQAYEVSLPPVPEHLVNGPDDPDLDEPVTSGLNGDRMDTDTNAPDLAQPLFNSLISDGDSPYDRGKSPADSEEGGGQGRQE